MTITTLRRFGILATLTGALLATSGITASAEVHFKDISFAEAKKLAAKTHKKIMVDYFTTWCGWCKVLDKQTYTDEAVGKTADAKFVCLKIDAEKGEGKDLAKEAHITGYPTIVFYNADGKEFDRVVGYEDAPKFLRSLKTAASGGTSAVIQELTKDPTNKDPEKWLIAANYYAQNRQNDKALTAYRNVVTLDPKNEQGVEQDGVYGVAFTTKGDQQWAELERAITDFPMASDGPTAAKMLLEHLLSTNKGDEAVRIMDRWAMQHPRDAETFNAFAWQCTVHGVALEAAEAYASRAEGLANDMQMRASIMDTRAEVVYKLNRPFESVDIEKQAMHLLDSVKDKKMYKELQAQLAKFEAAAQSQTAMAPGGQTSDTSGKSAEAVQSTQPAPAPTQTKYETSGTPAH